MAITLREPLTDQIYASGVVRKERRATTTMRYIYVEGDNEGVSAYRYAVKPPDNDTILPKHADAHPIDSSLRVSSIIVKGSGTPLADNGEGPDFEAALLEVSYTSFLSELDGLAIWTIEPRPFSIAYPGLMFADGTLLPEGQAYRPMDYQALIGNRTVTAYPGSAIARCVNKVNLYAWGPSGLGYTFDSGTVLFCSPRVTQQFDVQFGIVWAIQYQMLINDRGWNTDVNPTTGLWETVFDAYNNYVFPYADFRGVGV